MVWIERETCVDGESLDEIGLDENLLDGGSLDESCLDEKTFEVEGRKTQEVREVDIRPDILGNSLKGFTQKR